LTQRVSDELQKIIKELGSTQIEDLVSQVAGGKMLRPRLMLKISQNERIYELAAIIELIHIASLLHDDVIDSSLLRRQKPTVNATDGDKTAVMLGDILYSKAFSKLISFGPKIAYEVSSAVTTLSIGEMEDVEMGKSVNLNEELYLSMLYKKTGSLIEAAAVSAAMLDGIDDDNIRVYGQNLGVAFQLIDDLLDIISDEKTLGKQPFSDFKEGKTTIAFIHLYKNGDIDATGFLDSIYRKEPSEEEIKKLLGLFRQYGSIEYALSLAKEISKKAVSAIQKSALPADKSGALAEITSAQLQRLS
jgi:octaprenyl-diphosphate synthase